MSRINTGKNLGKGCTIRAALTTFGQILTFILLISAFISCKKESYPKPIAYPRLEYPAANYQQLNLPDLPVSFEYPTYATIVDQAHANKNWVNLRFTSFGATLYMSLSEVPLSKLDTMLLDKERLAIEQAPPTSEVRKEEFEAINHQFTGYFYLTDGNAACPIQFLLNNHQGKLFQGSLLFDATANRDSLTSMISGLTRDVRHLVETFQFKN